jgi:hypothetical protein
MTAQEKGNATLAAARDYLRAGLSLIPIARDGTKAPAWGLLPQEWDEAKASYRHVWAPFQSGLPTLEEIEKWFDRDEPPGIGIIGGAVSGGLEQLDFDVRAQETFPRWCGLVEAEVPGLIARLPIVKTPRDPAGYHVRYRVAGVAVPGNLKLAQDPSLPRGKRVLIETRGEGGYALAPGCPAACHETGRLYEQHSGPPVSAVPTITAEEREVLIRCARAFDLAPVDESPTQAAAENENAPGTDFNARGPDWGDLLTPAGWVEASKVGNRRLWRRPGKARGWSATTGHCTGRDGTDRLYVFSSAAAPFEPEKPYSRFAAYTLLRHSGDFRAAARDLAEQGFGTKSIRGTAAHAKGDAPVEIVLPKEPKRPDAAFYGPAGELVRAIDPHTEADSLAILVQTLLAFGNCIGRSAHFVAEQDRHYLNLFGVLVGRTSKARKGSSWGHVCRFFEGIDPHWAKECIQGGLSSGEGLAWAIRDPIYKKERARRGKGASAGPRVETVMVDDGVSDKRLLCYEPEFASVLKTSDRQGSILSAQLRQAWDGVDLRTLTKNSPARATNPHVAVIGHVTEEELRRYLSATEQANGFGNRFLWLLVKRSKILPEGGALRPEALAEHRRVFNDAVAFARKQGAMGFTDAGRELWHQEYEALSDGKPGLFGALTARAEAQVRRLACLYALLDTSADVDDRHLRAALALWSYCAATVRYVFGDTLGDPTADEILAALRLAPGGMTRDEIRTVLFQRHKTSAEIARALAVLVAAKAAYSTREETAGRPVERWFATGRPDGGRGWAD